MRGTFLLCEGEGGLYVIDQHAAAECVTGSRAAAMERTKRGKAAGKELALLYSLVMSCQRCGVNPVAYLEDVLNRIDTTSADAMRELLPERWTPLPEPPVATDFIE